MNLQKDWFSNTKNGGFKVWQERAGVQSVEENRQVLQRIGVCQQS